jgi:Domain of unknown function (DUF4386)
MTIHTRDVAQGKAAKLAGVMYLLTMATANFADFYVRRRLFVPADPMQTVGNIAASGTLVRAGVGSDLITIAGGVILIVALYVILKPINRNAALVAVFWWLLECSVAAVVTLNSLAALFLLSGKDPLRTFSTEQLETLAQLFVSVDRAGNRISAVLFGLGSALFCYLWFKSRYIPRFLAAWGLLSSLVPILVPLSTIIFPDLIDAPLRRARSGLPIMTFEVMLGLWLLVKGLPAPIVQQTSTGY